MPAALSRLRPTHARVRRGLEALGAPILYLALRYVGLYRPSFHQTSPWIYRFADRLGIYPVLDHYHDPLVRPSNLDEGSLGQRRSLPDLDLRVEEQLSLLSSFRFGDELEAIARGSSDALAPTFDNLAFGPGDAELLYSLIRHFQPSRVIEIGSGHSTRFAKAALDRNRAEGTASEHICVEPYESAWLEDLGVRVLRERVEDLDASLFSDLDAGDVLFIDSSHIVRPQGDVLYLLHDVLPMLPPGVLVHIHDIYTPRDYPRAWLERRWFWTEQYVVEALLRESRTLEVVLAANMLFQDHAAALYEACPVIARLRTPEPGSLWLRTVAEQSASRRKVSDELEAHDHPAEVVVRSDLPIS